MKAPTQAEALMTQDGVTGILGVIKEVPANVTPVREEWAATQRI